MNAELRELLALLDEAFERSAWHGPTLRGSLRGVSAPQAGWRPRPARHTIREIVVHAAYWKHVARARLTGERGERFALAGTNWFARAGGERAWRADVRLLVDEHRRLRAAVARLDPSALGRRVHGKAHTAEYTIRGIALHDVYHAGQIQLLKALRR